MSVISCIWSSAPWAGQPAPPPPRGSTPLHLLPPPSWPARYPTLENMDQEINNHRQTRHSHFCNTIVVTLPNLNNFQVCFLTIDKYISNDVEPDQHSFWLRIRIHSPCSRFDCKTDPTFFGCVRTETYQFQTVICIRICMEDANPEPGGKKPRKVGQNKVENLKKKSSNQIL